VLVLLVAHPTERFTLAEIQRRTGINPASAHALLSVLTDSGYVQRHPTARTYSLGPALVAAGLVAAHQQPALRDGQQSVDRLSEQLDLEVVLTAATDTEIVVVGRSSGSSGFGEVIHVGQRMPLRPPLGTIFLAWAPDAVIEAWLDRARPSLSIDERQAQHRALQAVRARGYAVGLESTKRRDLTRFVAEMADSARDVSEALEQLVAELAHTRYHLDELDSGDTYDVGLVAGAIFDAHGRVCAALTVNGLRPGMSGADVDQIGQLVLAEVTRITKATHGRPPENHR